MWRIEIDHAISIQFNHNRIKLFINKNIFIRENVGHKLKQNEQWFVDIFDYKRNHSGQCFD